jgi:RimJ/RimL family protein N-acetyltransferase
MITVERTLDYELVRSIVTHPKIYPHVADDDAPKAEEWRPLESTVVWHILVRLDGEPAGVFILVPQNAVCYELHTCLLPMLWGSATEAGRRMFAWMFEHSPCRRIMTNVPDYNRLALRAAQNSGMREFGVNTKSYLKRGILCDQIMLGISKEASCR